MEISNIPWERLTMFLPLVLIALTGYYFKNNPPKKINKMMGYRTKRSMKSQASWDFAQVYSSGLLFTWSLAGIVGLALQLYTQKATSSTSFAFTGISVLLAIVIGTVYFTEKELKKNFG
ncbi:MAG: putative membrane protein [Saprospiraceae bacterium]|jgi:uncharacterized membrane protein|tara:strand:+ start:947 stop:1303 length:357 start_codon:yes stop_codon:yes gene_type:complete